MKIPGLPMTYCTVPLRYHRRISSCHPALWHTIFRKIWNKAICLARSGQTDSVFFIGCLYNALNHRRGPVFKGVGHLDNVWSYGVRDRREFDPRPVQYSRMSLSSDPGDWYGFLIWTWLSFQIMNLFRTLSSWGSGNYSGADNMHFWGESCKMWYKHQSWHRASLWSLGQSYPRGQSKIQDGGHFPRWTLT